MTAGTQLARRWDAYACETRATELFALADDLDRAYERLSRVHAGLGDWRGPAADRALPRVRLAALRISRLAGMVRQAADAVKSGLLGVAEAVRLAAGPVQSPREAAAAVALATAVDRRIAAGLAAVVVAPAVDRPGRLPAPELPPAEVARWWTALAPHLRRLVLARNAADLGRLPGLPADVRDTANRILLSRLLRDLRAERDRLVGAPLQLTRTSVVRSMLAIAEDVERTLAALAGHRPPARLLTLDLTGSGRVAIGIGDVDRARHLAVLVPGMGSAAVHGVEGTVRRAGELCRQAAQESVEPTAVLAWIGYASPGLRAVPFADRARAGGLLLADDVAALAAGATADGGKPPHLTLVGHSYGSTVIGAATRSRPRIADDLVLVGSPGVLAEHADDLGLPAARVYVGEAPLDPVADLGAFGADPGDERFGATRMRADPGPGGSWPGRLTGVNHSHYFDPGSESLRNIARVVVGRGPDVSRVAS